MHRMLITGLVSRPNAADETLISYEIVQSTGRDNVRAVWVGGGMGFWEDVRGFGDDLVGVGWVGCALFHIALGGG